MVLVALFAVPAAALAAAPETPVMSGHEFLEGPETVVRGTLDPGQSGSGLETFGYEFLYRESATECEGGSATAEETSAGEGAQPVAAGISGLTSGGTYTVCLLARNGEGTSTSAPETFEVPAPPQTPETKAATGVTTTSATLNAVINQSGEGSAGSLYSFEYSRSDECEGREVEETLREPAPTAEGATVSYTLTGLRPASTYTYCAFLRTAFNERAEGQPVTFRTETAAPLISGERVESTTSSETVVRASINPGGLTTRYHVEYVTAAQFVLSGFATAARVPATDAELPAATEPVPVLGRLVGLEAGTTYFFRFVTDNGDGPSDGGPTEFSTVTGAGSGTSLPDGRVAELVNADPGFAAPYYPPLPQSENGGADSALPFQSSEDGEAIAYIGDPPSTGGSGTIGSGLGNQWLARRFPGGWVDQVLSPEGSRTGTNYQGFSADLDRGFVMVDAGAPALAPGAPSSCWQLYRRDNLSATYSPTFTTTQTPGECGRPLFAGEGDGGEDVIFQTEAALLPGTVTAGEPPEDHPLHYSVGAAEGEACMFGCNLYLDSGGHLVPVNVLPGSGEAAPSANFGGFSPGLRHRIGLSNAISTDGSEVFWTDTVPGEHAEQVFVLEHQREEVPVSVGAAEFWTATPNGRFAYYTEGGALWRFDTAANTRQALAGPGADVLGVIGTNEEGEPGRYLYFVAEGEALATNVVENGAGPQSAQPGQPNLYVTVGGVTTFIATLSPKDDKVTGSGIANNFDYGDWQLNLGNRTAELTPNGENLIFISRSRLTAYDNYAPAAEESATEAYIFDATQGTIRCASCDPAGDPPTAHKGETEEGFTPLPVSITSVSMRRWISAKGERAFFVSTESLAPQVISSRVSKTYEWEAEGTGSCVATMPARQDGGCIFSLSGTGSTIGTAFVDADREGDNVFVVHQGALGDNPLAGSGLNLYDLRIGGGFDAPSTSCGGAQCEVEPGDTAGSQKPAPSVAIEGLGNVHSPAASRRQQKLQKELKRCRKLTGKSRRVQCEKKARRHSRTAAPKGGGK
jgi:hypothetical protein